MLKRLFLLAALCFIYPAAIADVKLWYNPYETSCGSGASPDPIADCSADAYYSRTYPAYGVECQANPPYYNGTQTTYYKAFKRSKYDTCSSSKSKSVQVSSRLCPDGTTALDADNGWSCSSPPPPPAECQAPFVGTPPNCSCPAGTEHVQAPIEGSEILEDQCLTICPDGAIRDPETRSCCGAGEYHDQITNNCQASGNCEAKGGDYALNGATLPFETLPYYYCGGDGCTSTRAGGSCTLPESPDYPLCENVTYIYDGSECDPNQNGDGGGNDDPTDTCQSFQDAGTPCYAMCQSAGKGVGFSSYNCSTGDVIEPCLCSVDNQPPYTDGSGDGSGNGDGSGDSTDTTGDGQTDTGDTDGDGDSDGDTNNDGDSDFGDIIDAISEQTRQLQDSIQQQQTQAKIDAQRQVDAQTATTSAINEGTATLSNAVNSLSSTTSGNFQQNTAAINANGLRLDAVNTSLDTQTAVLEDIKDVLENGTGDEGNGSLTLPEGQDRQTVEEVGNKVLAAWERMKDAPIINAGAEVFGAFPSGGACPELSFSMSLFNNNQTISTRLHCDLYSSIAPALSAVMLAFWGILAVLVFKRF